MRANKLNGEHCRGFTLIELVIGIVLFSVAMVTVVSVIMPQSKQSLDPLWQVRAVALGQSLLTEISSKAFDEASLLNGRRGPCNNGSSPCTLSGQLGPDGAETRNNFDDIDDYHMLHLRDAGLALTGVNIANSSASFLTSDMNDLFLGFEARISVFYDQNADGVNDDDTNNDGSLDSGAVTSNQKLITVIIITPDGEQIPFATYRRNV